MLVALALRSVIAVALAVQPAGAPAPAAPDAGQNVPVQAPTAVPVQKPSAPTAAPTSAPAAAPTSAPAAAPTSAPEEAPTSAPAAAPTSAPARADEGGEGASAAEASPPPASSSAQTLPPPGVMPVVAPQREPAEIEGPIDEPAYDPLIDSPEAVRARHVVAGGIVFTVVGGVLTLGGIAMSTAKVNVPGAAEQPCDGRSDAAGNGCTPGGRQRAVAALAIPGALLLAGGVTMLIVGKLQQRRLRTTLQADKRGFMLGATLRF